MRAGWMAALVASAALAGCAGGEPANPNLAAPKLVLHPLPDGQVAVFIHGAFGERLYEWITLAVDNESVANRTTAFSLEESVPSQAFYFEAEAGTAREVYSLRGRVEIRPGDERVDVLFHDDEGRWGDWQSFGLPFQRVLVRRSAE